MATQWQTFNVEFKGGLISNMSLLQQGTNAIGSAFQLNNFEVNKEGGYSKILGFSKFSSTTVPGESEILGLKVISSTRIVAARKINSVAVGSVFLDQSHTTVATTSSNLTATFDSSAGTLTNSGTQAAFAISGTAYAVGSKIKVNAQTTTAQNGIYQVTTAGDGSTNWVLTRLTTFAFTNSDIGKTAYYVGTGTTWTPMVASNGSTVAAVSNNTNGLKVKHAEFNFDGDDKVVFVDGKSYPAIYNQNGNFTSFLTSSSTNINTDVEGADNVVIFKRTAFYSKGNTVFFTAPLTVDNFSVADGAGSISLAHDITGMAVFREQLVIFTSDTISRLVGNTSADFQLQSVTEKIGCIDKDTVQEVGGDIMYLSPDGIRQLGATDRIGDFALDVASDKIKETFLDFVGGESQFCSHILRGKSQYRIFAYLGTRREASSEGLIATKVTTQGSAGIEWSTCKGIKAFVADSVYEGAVETLAFANNDGYVYKGESGSTFDGSKINAVFQSAFMPINDPGIRKTFYKAVWFIDPFGTIDLDFNLKFDFESNTRNSIIQPDTINILTNAGSVAFFNQGFKFGTAFGHKFGSLLNKIYPVNLIGSGKTVSLRIQDNTTNPSFTLDTAMLEYKTNDRQ